MSAVLELESTLSSKGQVTLPAQLRALLGLTTGSKIHFIHDGETTTMRVDKPVRAYFGILKHLGNIDTTIPKEKDRSFE
jgi:AbrB family looped-hinge helix DNA binding protein